MKGKETKKEKKKEKTTAENTKHLSEYQKSKENKLDIDVNFKS